MSSGEGRTRTVAERGRAVLRLARTRLGESRAVWRAHGVLASIRAMLSGLVPFFTAIADELTDSERFYLFAMDSSASLERSRVASADHEFVFANSEDLERVAGCLPGYVLPNAVYLVHGDCCLLQFDGDELVGCIWSAGSQIACMTGGVYWNLPTDCFYSYLGYTRGEWRGNGYQPLRKQMLLDEHTAKGKQWLLGYVQAQAMPALRGTLRSLDRKVGVLRLQTSHGRTKITLEVDRDFWSTEGRF